MNDCSISEGRSGAFFVKTRNRRYIIKFVKKSEYRVLQDILQALALHFIHPHDEGTVNDLHINPILPADFTQSVGGVGNIGTASMTGHRRKPSNLSVSNSTRQPLYGGYLPQSTPRSVASQHSRHVTPTVRMSTDDFGRILVISFIRLLLFYSSLSYSFSL